MTAVVDPLLVVLADIATERRRQDASWGEQNHPDGTGRWEHQKTAAIIYREACQKAAARGGELTWLHILTEEVYEAFAESDPEKLRDELVQVAAVAVAWIEAIDRRTGGLAAGSGSSRRAQGAEDLAQPKPAAPERPVDLWFGAPPRTAAPPAVRDAERSSVIGVSSRFTRIAGEDWVRLRTGSGRQYEGHRSRTCAGDDVPGHHHDVRCVEPPGADDQETDRG